MKKSSTPPTQLSNNDVYALSSERKALKAHPKAGNSKRKPSKKAFIPKQYPKPTLAELAILVGTIKQNPQEQPLVEKTLPYQLKWVEQGVEISIYSENQAFISAQMLRLQTQKVQPMKPLAPKSQRMIIPSSQENRESPPEETLTTTVNDTTLSEYVEPAPTEIVSVSREQQQQQTITPSINPSEAWLNSASTSELSALLGMLEGDYSGSPIEEPYPADIDLEFQTPVEAKIAAYLGVPYSSKTTISVTEQQPSVTDDNDALLLQENEPALIVVTTDDDFSEEIEIDLDQQKAWLAAALEREKQKAYPLPKVEIAPLVAVEVEATAPLATEVIETVDTLLITTPPEEPDEVVAGEEGEAICLPLAQTTSAAEEERREAIALLEEEILPPAVVKDNNEQAFAAVLDSLMEDFSSSDDEDDETPALKAVVLLNEPTEDSVPAEFQNTLEHHEPFEVVGFYAQQATVEPSTASERREANGDDELSPSSGEITSENESDNPFDEITSFHQLLKVTTPNTPTDFLLLGTFFLKQTEQTNAFSLRQLNQLLSSASKPNANHTVLELALSNHFITMVPDLTGLATATQYQLSKRGEASALRLFQAVTLQTQTA